jgi:hypothetical protein
VNDRSQREDHDDDEDPGSDETQIHLGRSLSLGAARRFDD